MTITKLSAIILASFIFLPLQAWSLVNALDQDLTQDEAVWTLSWIQKNKKPGIFKSALATVTTKYFKGNNAATNAALAKVAAPAIVSSDPGFAKKLADIGSDKKKAKAILAEMYEKEGAAYKAMQAVAEDERTAPEVAQACKVALETLR